MNWYLSSKMWSGSIMPGNNTTFNGKSEMLVPGDNIKKSFTPNFWGQQRY
jgi:hypothetical protein